MARCLIRLLGSMQITLDGKPLRGLESAKVRALLAYLAVESAQAHERESLAGLFWPEMPEAQARHSLSQALYNLRQALGQASKGSASPDQPASLEPFLLVTPLSVQFNPLSDHTLDSRDFEQLIAETRQHDHRRRETCLHCAHQLRQAAQLYQGDFLTGVSLRECQALEEWILVWRERLRGLFYETLANLALFYEGRAELHQALEICERWARVDLYSEPAQRALMRLLALDGQRAQALARYAGFRCQLKAELGVEPARETQQLHQRILDEETSRSSLPGMPGRLPVPLTPFFGREDELAELIARLRNPRNRLVTLLGPGGSGKTRLALEAAQALRYDFPNGIFLVSLSGLSASEAFLPALASSLNLVFQQNWGEAFEQLLSYLQHRRLLLILDSFEEVPAASQQVTQLLQAASDLKILVTTRARLNVQAEQILPLEGLYYPDPASLPTTQVLLEDYSALQLFHATARQVQPDYLLTQADLPHVVRICQLVAGMPLGVVLAAGWLETLSPAEIAQEIEHSLDFLSAAWNDLPARQRSLRATLDHSWRLLGDDEQLAFSKLSVFQSAFTRQAASQVAAIDSAQLRALVDKSMLQTASGSYRMHDLLRQYAAELQAQEATTASQVRDAHSAYFLERLPERARHLKSARRSATLREMDAEINDLQAAWKWDCVRANLACLAHSLEGLCLYYEMRVRLSEGQQACQMGLDAIPPSAAQEIKAATLRTRLLLWQANFLVLSGKLEAAKQLHQQASTLLDQLEAQGADVRRSRAMYWQMEGETQVELSNKLACYQLGIALYQEAGEPWRQARMLIWAGEYAMRLGNPSLALQSQQEALRLARQVGEPDTLLHSLRQNTFLYFLLNQVDQANQLIQETAAYLEHVEELPLRASAEMYLGHTLTWNGRFAEAIQVLEGSVPKLRSLGYRYGVMYATFSLGLATMFNGDYNRSEPITQAGFQEAELGHFQREAAGLLAARGMSTLARGQTAQSIELFTESARRYRLMQFMGELGWAKAGLALAQEMSRQPEAALESLLEALHIAEKNHSMAAILTCMPAMVRLLFNRGHHEIALLVYRIQLLQKIHKNSRWYADVIGNEMNTHWEALPPEQRAEIDACANKHTPFSIIPEVLARLEKETA